MSKDKSKTTVSATSTAPAAATATTSVATSSSDKRGGPTWMGRIRANLRDLKTETKAPVKAIEEVEAFLATLPDDYGQQVKVVEVSPGDVIQVLPGTDARSVLDMLGVKDGIGKVLDVIKGKGECRCEFSGAKGAVTLPIRKSDMMKTPMK